MRGGRGGGSSFSYADTGMGDLPRVLDRGKGRGGSVPGCCTVFALPLSSMILMVVWVVSEILLSPTALIVADLDRPGTGGGPEGVIIGALMVCCSSLLEVLCELPESLDVTEFLDSSIFFLMSLKSLLIPKPMK